MKLPVEWYQRTTRRIQEQMGKEGYDGLLLLDNYNVFYTTGFFHQTTERPLGVYIPASGNPTLYVPLVEKEMAEATWIEDIKWYFDFPGKVPALKWILDNIPSKLKIGIDRLEARDWLKVQSIRPSASLSDLVYTMRLVKTEEEIAILEKAGIYADYMVEKAREAILMGLSETDAFSYLREKTTTRMQAELGELVMVNMGLMNGAVRYGENTVFAHGMMTDRKPHKGDSVICSFGALVCTYESESEHNFFYGEPDARQLSYFTAMYDAWKICKEVAGPGKTCAEVNEAALDVIRTAGYEKYIRHRIGHGKGLQEHEAPWIEAGDQTVLLPGMVISDEPGIYIPGYGGFHHSDTLVITETGCRRITHYPRDIDHCILPV